MAAIIFNVLPLIPYLSVFIFVSLGGPSGVQPAPQAAAAALRALRAALANAHAFPQLRAPTGSSPWRGNKKAAGIRQSLFYSMVGRQGFSLLRRRPLRRFRALRAALANAHAFTQLRAPTGSNPCTGNKRATNRSRSLSFLWWAVRGSACSAGGRCGAFAPCALRWQTLTRLLSSAPRRVRTRASATKKRPAGADRFLFYGGPSGVRTLDLGIKSEILFALALEQ